MKHKFSALALLAAVFATPALAAEQTIRLSVPGMSCPSCPYIIKAAIGDVDGVRSVAVSFETRSAVVVYDDDITTARAITSSTLFVGYPSQVIESGAGS
jgi:periplasmic mercuric ion binding protein